MNAGFTLEEFTALLDQWLANVRTEAIYQFTGGVAHEPGAAIRRAGAAYRCVQIAISIVDARDIARVLPRS